jgi:very-short-patch-repair endonuclease
MDRRRGIPATSPARTQFDLAAVFNRRQMERVLNEAEVLGLTDRLSLPHLLERYSGRRGSALLRELLADDETLRGVTRSTLEERFASLVEAASLPRPKLNAAVSVRGRFFEADCLWERQRLIVELDGRAAHGTESAFEKDRERDRLLLADGWRVVHLTWHQLEDEANAIVEDLRQLLARGSTSTDPR